MMYEMLKPRMKEREREREREGLLNNKLLCSLDLMHTNIGFQGNVCAHNKDRCH